MISIKQREKESNGKRVLKPGVLHEVMLTEIEMGKGPQSDFLNITFENEEGIITDKVFIPSNQITRRIVNGKTETAAEAKMRAISKFNTLIYNIGSNVLVEPSNIDEIEGDTILELAENFVNLVRKKNKKKVTIKLDKNEKGYSCFYKYSFVNRDYQPAELEKIEKINASLNKNEISKEKTYEKNEDLNNDVYNNDKIKL